MRVESQKPPFGGFLIQVNKRFSIQLLQHKATINHILATGRQVLSAFRALSITSARLPWPVIVNTYYAILLASKTPERINPIATLPPESSWIF